MITTENKMDSEVDYNTQGHYTQIRNTGGHKAADDDHNNYSVIDRAIDTTKGSAALYQTHLICKEKGLAL